MSHFYSNLPMGKQIVSDELIFEQPVTERIRTFLRLQQLFQRIDFHLERKSAWDTQAAISTLLEIINLTTRGDLKGEVIKELERQKSAIQNSPDSDLKQLQLIPILECQAPLIEQLHNQKGQLNQNFQNNEFLNAIRRRRTASGNTCSFDLPAYHHWLKRPSQERHGAIKTWLQPFDTVKIAIDTILDAIRETPETTLQTAHNGFFQLSLNPTHPLQMIRIYISGPPGLFPEMSVGKHRFTIRFFAQTAPEKKADQVQSDVEFQLGCCIL